MIGGTQDVPDEDGKTTKGDQPPDDVSIDGEPSERVSNDGNVLVHAPDLSNHTRSPPDVELCHQITNVEVPVEQQVSRVQQQGKWPECTFDRHSSHPIAPLSLYPVPIPTTAMRCSSCTCRTLIHCNEPVFKSMGHYSSTPEHRTRCLTCYVSFLFPCLLAYLDVVSLWMSQIYHNTRLSYPHVHHMFSTCSVVYSAPNLAPRDSLFELSLGFCSLLESCPRPLLIRVTCVVGSWVFCPWVTSFTMTICVSLLMPMKGPPWKRRFNSMKEEQTTYLVTLRLLTMKRQTHVLM